MNLLVPLEVARAAVRHFVEHQQLDPSLKWDC
jgi:hypothetical protein